ncbi:MAG: leucine-rich repeat domain-containing protein [Bacteroidota bacterium]
MKNLSATLIAAFLLALSPLYAQYDANRNVWFTDLEKAFKDPLRVYNLDLSNQGLDTIPAYIQRFPNLIALKLSDNTISALNDNLSTLSKLEFLELSGNKLTSIDFTLFKKAKFNLEEIWLRDNKITEIDSTIQVLRSLKLLNLGNNQIEHIDPNIRLKHLESLYLDYNVLQVVPALVYTAYKLEYLNLNANQLKRFELNTGLRNLKSLNIGDNPIESLQFKKSKYKLSTLILDWIDLSKQNLKQLPFSIQILSLEHCQLYDIEGIAHLKNLKELSVIYNELQQIPEALKSMRELEKLWIKGNPLDGSAVAHLTKVEIID